MAGWVSGSQLRFIPQIYQISLSVFDNYRMLVNVSLYFLWKFPNCCFFCEHLILIQYNHQKVKALI